MIGISGNTLNDMPHGKGGITDTTGNSAIRRDMLMRDVYLIDRCAAAVQNGAYARAIVLNVCYGTPFDRIRY